MQQILINQKHNFCIVHLMYLKKKNLKKNMFLFMFIKRIRGWVLDLLSPSLWPLMKLYYTVITI